MDSNGDGSGLTYWTIALIMAATLFLVYVIKRFRGCRKRANERHAAEAARDARFHALALMPRNQVDRLNDRLEELDINITNNARRHLGMPLTSRPTPRRDVRGGKIHSNTESSTAGPGKKTPCPSFRNSPPEATPRFISVYTLPSQIPTSKLRVYLLIILLK